MSEKEVELDEVQVVEVTGKVHHDKPRKAKKTEWSGRCRSATKAGEKNALCMGSQQELCENGCVSMGRFQSDLRHH